MPSSTDPSLSEYPIGSIIHIKLIDFLTYDVCEIHPGPYMNMIIGPNGSGKSTIVAAMALGLGAPLTILGRSTSISQFVKYGKEKATIEITIKNPSTTTPTSTIKRIFKRKNNTSEWFIDDSKTTHSSILSLCKNLHVQLENLCQFLPQDKVSEFARLTPQELLLETIRAVQPSFESDYEQLIQQRQLQRNEEKAIQLSRQDSLQLSSIISQLKIKVDRYNERIDLCKQIEILCKKRPWIEYNEARQAFLLSKDIRDRSVSVLRQKEKSLDPLKLSINQLEQESQNYISTIQDYKSTLDTNYQPISTLQKEIQIKLSHCKSRLSDIQGLSKYASEQQIKINNLLAEISVIQNKMSIDPPKLDPTIEDRLISCSKQRSELDKIIEDLHTQSREIMQEGTSLNRKINEANDRLAKYEDIRQAKIDFLRQREPDTFQALQWFAQNKKQFKMAAFEPVCLEIQLADMRYADVIEASLSKQAMTSFVFADENDYDLFLSSIHDQSKLQINAILINIDDRLSGHSTLLTKQQIQEFGFDCYLVELIKGPELVIFALCEHFKIHQCPVALGSVSYESIDSCKDIAKYFANGQLFESRRDPRTGKSNIVMSRPVKSAKFFNIQTVQPDIQSKLQRDITEWRRQLLKNSETSKEILLKEEREQVKLSKLEQEYNECMMKKKQFKSELFQYQNLGKLKDLKIKELETIRNERPPELLEKEYKNDLYSTINNIIRYLESLNIQDVVQTKIGLDQATIQWIRNNTIMEQKRLELKEAESTLTESINAFQQAEEQYNLLKKRAKELLERAKENPITDELKEQFKMLPDVLQELDDLISTENAKLQLQHDIDPDVVQEYEKRKSEYDNMQRELIERQARLESSKNKLESILNVWLPNINDMINRIDKSFSLFFTIIHCVGQVRLNQVGDDYDQWGIDILVKFRDEERLSILNSERQSGGERSVSTILYLMSLQETNKSPFRVVDEINQGMDPRNERLIHSIIVDTATKHDGQYFLITPKLLLDLPYNNRMKIHCVYNGEWLPDHNEWTMSSIYNMI